MKTHLFLLLSFFIIHPASFAQPNKKLPRIHYFYNSGWLLETEKHILIFDFVSHDPSGITLANLQQQINAAKSDKEILVLVTHGHNDHFDETVFNLAGQNKNMRFLFGWDPGKKPAVEAFDIVKPGDSLIAKNFSLYAHTATDEGSGFLITIDGLTIYHAGDHALWVEELLPDFTRELKYIRRKADVIDIAFLPAARGMFTKCAYDSVIAKGLKLSAEILTPRTIALQHIGCTEKLSLYKTAREDISPFNAGWIIPEKYNQSF